VEVAEKYRSVLAVNMGEPPEYDPVRETEYLLLEDITAAEDNSLTYLVSTYSPIRRLTSGPV
jgi:hypothetical protein